MHGGCLDLYQSIIQLTRNTNAGLRDKALDYPPGELLSFGVCPSLRKLEELLDYEELLFCHPREENLRSEAMRGFTASGALHACWHLIHPDFETLFNFLDSVVVNGQRENCQDLVINLLRQIVSVGEQEEAEHLIAAGFLPILVQGIHRQHSNRFTSPTDCAHAVDVLERIAAKSSKCAMAVVAADAIGAIKTIIDDEDLWLTGDAHTGSGGVQLLAGAIATLTAIADHEHYPAMPILVASGVLQLLSRTLSRALSSNVDLEEVTLSGLTTLEIIVSSAQGARAAVSSPILQQLLRLTQAPEVSSANSTGGVDTKCLAVKIVILISLRRHHQRALVRAGFVESALLGLANREEYLVDESTLEGLEEMTAIVATDWVCKTGYCELLSNLSKVCAAELVTAGAVETLVQYLQCNRARPYWASGGLNCAAEALGGIAQEHAQLVASAGAVPVLIKQFESCVICCDLDYEVESTLFVTGTGQLSGCGHEDQVHAAEVMADLGVTCIWALGQVGQHSGQDITVVDSITGSLARVVDHQTVAG